MISGVKRINHEYSRIYMISCHAAGPVPEKKLSAYRRCLGEKEQYTFQKDGLLLFEQSKVHMTKEHQFFFLVLLPLLLLLCFILRPYHGSRRHAYKTYEAYHNTKPSINNRIKQPIQLEIQDTGLVISAYATTS